MEFKIYVGIDVSKLTLDVFIREKLSHKKFKNDKNGFESLLRWLEKQTATAFESILICFEHTGLYSLPLAVYLEENDIPYSMISALAIKRSLGITRGKNDYIDSRRIADFSYRYKDKISLTRLPAQDIAKLQSLLTLRGRLSVTLGRFTVSKNEAAKFMGRDGTEELFLVYDNMISTIKEQIKNLERSIKEVIGNNEKLKLSYELVTSVKGVGLIVACYLISYTHNFTRFSTWRKFACYSGIAPFDHQSGTSVKGRTQVSSIANKEMKRILHLAAICAIHTDAEMTEYYSRRQNEGKHKMTIINIVRNKIVSRVFAIVKRGTPFVDLKKYAS
ncbi:IS110 family transposase [Chryseobacterium culicis]|uniref:IS110 family transposase n=1 Tax=Chryseobacterium culicis TaxID=680127 RepID=UPI002896DE4F|nr:IS110 family transposase [Chryseobacterium culicis]